MPTETECKIPVADFGPIEARLQELGAEAHGEFFQDDRFFDSPERRLLEADQGLRLRSVVREDQAGAARAHPDVQGARQQGQLKQREEIEAGVSDPQAMVEVLDRLGFTLMLHLQKRRKRYRLGGCWVELDTVPLLGRFVEVEGPAARRSAGWRRSWGWTCRGASRIRTRRC